MGIYINYGTKPAEMAEEIMREADVASRLKPDARVTIKPNLVVAREAAGGATTHPEIVEGVIRYLRANGVRDIAIAEGSSVGEDTERAFERCGYAALAKKYGVKLVNTKRDRAVEGTGKYAVGMKICESAAYAGFLINMPVLKGHCQTGLTCCLKNMKGLIPDSEKRRYHSMGLSKPIAALSSMIKPDLHIIDGICGDLDFEEGGNPVVSNRILLGFDPVLLDSYCATLIGYHPDDIGYLRLAKEYGLGAYAGPDTPIVELNAGSKPRAGQNHGAGARKYAPLIDEDGACSACYAALIYALRQTGGKIPPAAGKAPSTAGKAPSTAGKATSVSGSASSADGSTPSAADGGKIKIGQGFKGKTLAGIGVGNCTSGCGKYARGCPPTALDIVNFLSTL